MWGRNRKSAKEGFPDRFTVQRIGVAAANIIADLPPADIARYFHDHPEVAEDLLTESYDKRYTPSTYITKVRDGFEVGWFTSNRQCVRQFPDLADAATDYLLFSLGKGRWTEPEQED